MAERYLTQQYYGCCGAAIIFFGDAYSVEQDRLEATLQYVVDQQGYGMITCALIPRQSGHRHLVAAGFKIVARTMGRTNNLIRFYVKEANPAPTKAARVDTPEVPRAFGAHQ
jgi:hypothetical protein